MQFGSAEERSQFFRRLRLLTDDLSEFASLSGALAAVGAMAADHTRREALNRDALFWNGVIGSMQNAALVAVARIHDNRKGAYLKNFVASLRKSSSAKANEAAALFDAAIAKHAPLISQILRLRHGLLAHTSFDAPVIALFGFEGLTHAVAEAYWNDMAIAVKSAELAVAPEGGLFPTIDLERRSRAAESARNAIAALG